ncbi:XK-related protein 6-like [Branchiostoma floridae x Branchiostoma japonicum]
MDDLKSAWKSKTGKVLRLVVFPLGLYIFDVVTDLVLAVQYWNSGDMYWFGWTLGFVIGPSIIMNIAVTFFSGLCALVLGFLQLGVVSVYFKVMYKLLKDENVEVLEEYFLKVNLPLGHLFEATLESIPQLCLQLYIMLYTREKVSALKVISMLISLISAVKAVTTYWWKKVGEKSSSWLLALFVIWKLMELTVRVVAIGVIATNFQEGVIICLVTLFVITSLIAGWIRSCESTNKCCDLCNVFGQMILVSPMMAVDTFSMVFSLKEWIMFWLNTTMTLLGNILMITGDPNWKNIPGLVALLVFSVLSACMGIVVFYYDIICKQISGCKNQENRVGPDAGGTNENV